MPQKARKRRRGHSSEPGSGRRRASRPGEVWALDFRFDVTNEGRQLKCLNVVDEFTRQALASEVSRSCDADGVLRVLYRLQAEQGAPRFLRMDNGQEMIAHALKDWCRLAHTGTLYIEPGSPWENAYVESFHSRMRNDYSVEPIFAGCRVEIKWFRQAIEHAQNPVGVAGAAGPRPRALGG